MVGNRELPEDFLDLESGPHPDNYMIGHSETRNYLERHAHIDLTPFRSVGMSKLYLEVDEVYQDSNGLLDKFTISKIEPKTIHKNLYSQFEVNYLVLYDRVQRQFFFIKNAKCMLTCVTNDIKADSCDPIVCNATYVIRYDHQSGYFWDQRQSRSVWYDPGTRFINNTNELSQLIGEKLNRIALKHWAPIHVHGNHDTQELNNNPMITRSTFEFQQGPVGVTTWIDGDLTGKDLQLQKENPHNEHERVFIPDLINNGWTAITPNGAKEPMLYKHEETGIFATSQNIVIKAELVRRKLERIKKRNKKTLEYYLKNRNNKKKIRKGRTV